jgi:hypothetical protein
MEFSQIDGYRFNNLNKNLSKYKRTSVVVHTSGIFNELSQVGF